MTNQTHKHHNCYPEEVDGALQSKDVALHNPSEVDHHCYCTMQKLCKALTVSIPNKDKSTTNTLLGVVHRMTTDLDNNPRSI